MEKRRASELLHENMHGPHPALRVARECGTFCEATLHVIQTSFGISTHQW